MLKTKTGGDGWFSVLRDVDFIKLYKGKGKRERLLSYSDSPYGYSIAL